MNPSACPVCKTTASVEEAPLKKLINCPRCGQFIVTVDVEVILGGEFRRGLRWAITSHAIRNMQTPGGEPFKVTQAWLDSVWTSQELPNPQMQADRFVEYLGKTGAPGEWVLCVPLEMTGLLGTTDDLSLGKTDGFTYIIEHLKAKELIEQHRHPSADGRKAGYRLTFDGWERFEELHRVSAESRIAFMAMGYGNPGVNQAFTEFVRAVEQTGFQLCRLDQKPKAGLIDLRMRVEIRSAKFLIADLTDENRGAYWEAGFTEGCGKKVYYTCEASKFEATKTHFDTEHLLTIKWSPETMPAALDELKSAIRNDFPTDAKQSDELMPRQ
jgi:DNA-binding PadR family transcriptional regulator